MEINNSNESNVIQLNLEEELQTAPSNSNENNVIQLNLEGELQAVPSNSKSIFDKTKEELTYEELVDKLYLARYYYAYGTDFMGDSEYTELVENLQSISPNHPIITTTWSEDRVPYDLLDKYNLPFCEQKKFPSLMPSEIKDLFIYNKDKISMYASDLFNRSIKLYRDYNLIAKWILDKYTVGVTDYHLSVKADGYNFEATYVKKSPDSIIGYLVESHTRGQAGDQKDITNQMYCILPTEINMEDTDIIKVSGELVLNPYYLPYLREKYNKKFKTSRNAVSTLLFTVTDIKDFCIATALVFKVKSPNLHSLSDEFKWAREHGFNIPPSYRFNYNGNPQQIWNIFKYFEGYRYKLPYGSDGMVLAVNQNKDFLQFGYTDKYFFGNIACKVGVWDAKNYTSTVVGIDWTHNTKKITPVLLIEPVKVSTGAECSRVSAHHPRRLIDLEIGIGTEIAFEYVSDTIGELIY